MRRRRSARWLIWWFFGCSLLALGFFATRWWQQEVVARVVAPLLSLQRSVTNQVRAWRIQRLGHDDLVTLLERTYRERDALLQRVIELESVNGYERETADIRMFRARYHCEKAIMGQVLLKNFSESSHFFLVDVGEQRGVRENMIAFSYNHLIGRVSEVTPSYCKVTLITDKSARVSAICTRKGARGIVEGTGDAHRLKLSFVSHFDEILAGDVVTSYGAGMVFPRGMGLGKVVSVDSAGVFYNVIVEPLVDLETVDFCLFVSRELFEKVDFEAIDRLERQRLQRVLAETAAKPIPVISVNESLVLPSSVSAKKTVEVPVIPVQAQFVVDNQSTALVQQPLAVKIEPAAVEADAQKTVPVEKPESPAV